MTRQILSLTIQKFFENLSEDGKKLMSLNIVSKFIENKSSEKSKKMKFLFNIYQRNENLSNLLNKKYFLNKWKRRVQDTIMNLSSTYNSNLNNSRSFILETSGMRKEREELRNCTFKPEINKNFDFYFNRDPSLSSIPVHQRLYTDHERLQNKRDVRKKEMDEKQSNSLPFSPDISLSSNPKHRRSKSKGGVTDFLQRQEKFQKSKEKNKKRIMAEVEDEIRNTYTFTPQILNKSTSGSVSGTAQPKNASMTITFDKNDKNDNFNFYNSNSNSQISTSRAKSKSSKNLKNLRNANNNNFKYQLNNSSSNIPSYTTYSTTNAPRHVRLYEDNQRRERNQQIKIRQIDEEIAKLSRSIEKERNNTLDGSKISRGSGSPTKGGVDYKKIQELYLDHKKQKMKKKDLQKVFDQESGLTFKPDLYTNEKYIPTSKFLDRNYKLLEDKKNFVEMNKQIIEENLENQKWGAGKKYSTEDLEAIHKGLIDRLYNKGVEKHIQRNSIDTIVDRESLDFKKYLRNQDQLNVNISSDMRKSLSNPSIQETIIQKSDRKKSLEPSSSIKEKETYSKDSYPLKLDDYNSINLMSNYKDKNIPVDNYTFGKDRKFINFYDKNPDYEERVKPLNNSKKINSGKKKNPANEEIVVNVDTLDQDAHSSIGSNSNNFSNTVISTGHVRRASNDNSDR
jgi:hypothetical protein